MNEADNSGMHSQDKLPQWFSLIGLVGGSAIVYGLLVTLGFAVNQTFSTILGLPSPAIGPSDYLTAAGSFMMDIAIRVLFPALFAGVFLIVSVGLLVYLLLFIFTPR